MEEQETEDEEEELSECERCNQEWLDEEMSNIDGTILCPECVWDCGQCGQSVNRDDTYFISGYGDICSSCREDYFTSCYECGRDLHIDHAETDEDGDHFCSRCHNSRNTPIREYHSSHGRLQVHPSPWSRSHNNRYFGVELEVEAGEWDNARSIAQGLKDWEASNRNAIVANPTDCPLFVMETDGSLNCGFELITVPMGLDDQRAFWPKLLQRSNVRGLTSHTPGTCGLHIHVSKRGLTRTQIARMVCFVNDENNATLVRAIARRGSNEYNKISKKEMETALSSYDRYEAVNITNDATVEFRIFRGSLKKDAVLAALEFTNAVVEYCADHRKKGADFSTLSFLKFVCSPEMAKETETLRPYLASRGVTLPSLSAV